MHKVIKNIIGNLQSWSPTDGSGLFRYDKVGVSYGKLITLSKKKCLEYGWPAVVLAVSSYGDRWSDLNLEMKRSRVKLFQDFLGVTFEDSVYYNKLVDKSKPLIILVEKHQDAIVEALEKKSKE